VAQIEVEHFAQSRTQTALASPSWFALKLAKVTTIRFQSAMKKGIPVPA